MPVSTIEELWEAFWGWTESHAAGAFLFRGQADASPILPKIGRSTHGFDPAREKALFDAFERAARPFLEAGLNRFESLALAQYHGAPTRLVDWSTTPLVAGWFAVSSYPENQDAKIYALDVTRADLDLSDAKSGQTTGGAIVSDPLAIREGTYLIETAQVSRRITTQRGIFTLHGDPTIALAIASRRGVLDSRGAPDRVSIAVDGTRDRRIPYLSGHRWPLQEPRLAISIGQGVFGIRLRGHHGSARQNRRGRPRQSRQRR